MRNGTSSRSIGGGGAGGSNSTSSPPTSFHDFGRGSPSTRTPASITRSAFAREPTCSAMKRSSRSPAASSGTRTVRTVREHEHGEQNADADHDEAVREVERRPPLQVEEVGHVPQPDTVDEVREAASDDEPERDRQDGMPCTGAREEHEHPRDRDAREQDHDRGRARKQPERDSRVL